jgi:hypothetical protein
MFHPLVEFFRCPESLTVPGTAGGLSTAAGYFRLGDGIGYGRHVQDADVPAGLLRQFPCEGPTSSSAPAVLPFDLEEVVANLRHERYPEARQAVAALSSPSAVRALYYLLRPALPVPVRKHLQRFHWRGWERITFPRWPVDTSVESLLRCAAGQALAQSGQGAFPFIWFWPDGATACVMMTHDVEGPSGMRFCDALMDEDEAHGITSSFQVVPEAPWATPAETRALVERVRRRSFEVNIHDLSHDGSLFRHRERFLKQASTINVRAREFGSRGFRSGAMYRRQDWLTALDIAYDMSVPNVAHLEPQRGGCCTVFPYFNGHVLELPLTTAQDYTVFNVLGQSSTELWEQQVARILGEHGLISFITHPDYLITPEALAVYRRLLQRLDALRREDGAWVARPAEVDRWWRERQEMRIVPDGASWRIKGPGSSRARLAWVRLEDGAVVYELEPARRAA